MSEEATDRRSPAGLKSEVWSIQLRVDWGRRRLFQDRSQRASEPASRGTGAGLMAVFFAQVSQHNSYVSYAVASRATTGSGGDVWIE